MNNEFEIFAIRYARSKRSRSQCFIGDNTNNELMEMAYYIWLIRNSDISIVVDTGFDATVAKERKREFLIEPDEALRQLGTDPKSVSDVILTHLHYDHAGNHHLFKNARFHIQEAEMAYATGPSMRFKHLRVGYGPEDIKCNIDRLFNDRLIFHDGASEVRPGVKLTLIGGHCKGLQVVTVETQRGPIILASDAVVFFESLKKGWPFPATYHSAQELVGYEKILSMAGSLNNIIPGHDIEVMELYPEVIKGIAWRLDQVPIK